MWGAVAFLLISAIIWHYLLTRYRGLLPRVEPLIGLISLVPAIVGVVMAADQIQDTASQNSKLASYSASQARLLDRFQRERDIGMRLYVAADVFRQQRELCQSSRQGDERVAAARNLATRIRMVGCQPSSGSCDTLINAERKATLFAMRPDALSGMSITSWDISRLFGAIRVANSVIVQMAETQETLAIGRGVAEVPNLVEAYKSFTQNTVAPPDAPEAEPAGSFTWLYLLALAASIEFAKVTSRITIRSVRI